MTNRAKGRADYSEELMVESRGPVAASGRRRLRWWRTEFIHHLGERHLLAADDPVRTDEPVHRFRTGNRSLQRFRYLVRERGNDQLVRTPHRPRDCGERDRDRDLGAGQYKVRRGGRYGDGGCKDPDKRRTHMRTDGARCGYYDNLHARRDLQ